MRNHQKYHSFHCVYLLAGKHWSLGCLEDVPPPPPNVPRTSPKDHISASQGRPKLTSWGRPDLTSGGRLEMTSRERPWKVDSGRLKDVLRTSPRRLENTFQGRCGVIFFGTYSIDQIYLKAIQYSKCI